MANPDLTRTFAILLCSGGLVVAGCAGPPITAPELIEAATPPAFKAESLIPVEGEPEATELAEDLIVIDFACSLLLPPDFLETGP